MASNPVVRFAPSPTGLLHVGNVRTALFNWLFAKRHGGTFILRLDDTDRQRSKPEYEAAIERDLAWLGLDWARKERQSDRLPHYDAARDRLIAVGRLYPCYETPEELEFKRKRLLSQGRPPVYDRAALKLGDADRARLEGEGRRPHWRFKLATEEVRWDDLVRGPQHIDEASQSDPVLVRADGSYLYSFTSVVDDIAFAITHVIRGEDHVTNSAAQIQIFRALDAEVPAFAHLPLLVDAPGRRPQQARGLAVDRRPARTRHRGARHRGLAGAARHGRSGGAGHVARRAGGDGRLQPRRPRRRALLGRRAGASQRPHDPRPALRRGARAPAGDGRRAALARGARQPHDAWPMRGPGPTIVGGSLAPVLEDPSFLDEAAARLPPEPWGETTWKEWTAAVSAATQRKGRALFHPLRLALTARETGPEMAKLLPLIGRAKASARLSGHAGIRIAATPSATNSSAATTRTILSGRRLAMASPNSTTGALASSMPSVVPSSDDRQRFEAGGQRHRGDLRLVADLDQEEGDQRGEEGSRLARRLRALVGLVGDQAPARHDDEGGGQDPAHRLGARPRPRPRRRSRRRARGWPAWRRGCRG